MNDLIYKLEDFISLGYQFMEKIEEEYRSTPHEQTSLVLDKYYRIINEWEEEVKRELPNTSRKSEFSTAKSNDPTYQVSKSPEIQNLIKSIRAKVDVLKDYKKELQQPMIVQTGDQARNYFGSTDNSVNIISSQFTNIVNKLEKELEQHYAKEDKEELIRLIGELKKNESNGNKVREILGSILTRCAEIAQIASPVIQLLSMYKP